MAWRQGRVPRNRPEMRSVCFYEIKQPPELKKVTVASLHSQKTLETISALLCVLVACTNSFVATCYTFLLQCVGFLINLPNYDMPVRLSLQSKVAHQET